MQNHFPYYKKLSKSRLSEEAVRRRSSRRWGKGRELARKPTCHSSNFFNKTFALLIAGQTRRSWKSDAHFGGSQKPKSDPGGKVNWNLSTFRQSYGYGYAREAADVLRAAVTGWVCAKVFPAIDCQIRRMPPLECFDSRSISAASKSCHCQDAPPPYLPYQDCCSINNSACSLEILCSYCHSHRFAILQNLHSIWARACNFYVNLIVLPTARWCQSTQRPQKEE